ncbi:MAG: hypothetical protein QOI91_2238 [Solirubrobacteraceae bacterium]|jgi:hypothetical protein|nr:hypothetical protein [Solirubrobacteraceae bacterium]
MSFRFAPVAVAAAALAVAAAGCGGSSTSGSTSTSASAPPAQTTTHETSPAGDIPDNQAYVAYAPPGGGYSVKVPEGWSRTATGAATTFVDKRNSIRMESMPAAAAPTVAQAKGGVVPQLARTVPGYQPGTVKTVVRPAGPVVLITYLAAAKPDPVTGKAGVDAVERYVFFHGGKLVVLTLSGDKRADNVDPWKTVTSSLRFTR